jgi:hypothetical protein
MKTRRKESSYREQAQNPITTVKIQGKAMAQSKGTAFMLEATTNTTIARIT